MIYNLKKKKLHVFIQKIYYWYQKWGVQGELISEGSQKIQTSSYKRKKSPGIM